MKKIILIFLIYYFILLEPSNEEINFIKKSKELLCIDTYELLYNKLKIDDSLILKRINNIKLKYFIKVLCLFFSKELQTDIMELELFIDPSFFSLKDFIFSFDINFNNSTFICKEHFYLWTQYVLKILFFNENNLLNFLFNSNSGLIKI